MPLNRKIWLLFGGVLLLCIIGVYALETTPDRGYWVWGWPDLDTTRDEKEIVLYQGDITNNQSGFTFSKRGVSPHKLCCDKNVTLLIRVYQLPSPDYFVSQAEYLLESWREKGVRIQGLQIDHDSPSSQLNHYAAFLKELQLHYSANFISITGLATWLGDDLPAVRKVSENVDYIAFQLYQNHHPVTDYRKYIRILAKKFDSDYKLGITRSPKFKSMELPDTARFKGLMVFLNGET